MVEPESAQSSPALEIDSQNVSFCPMLRCNIRCKPLKEHGPENPNMGQKDRRTPIGKFVGRLCKLLVLIKPVRISVR